ncbi:MAG: DUF2997 domain-containing protein [Oscillospiraceae bacterium]|jgi:hypothetical protein|nr:DUF2997 domain-containing protein [Oscillospiraceae bacterium]
MKKQLQVRLYPDGRIEAKTLGIKGEKCTEYLQVLEQILSAKTVESAYTNEYYELENTDFDANLEIESLKEKGIV